MSSPEMHHTRVATYRRLAVQLSFAFVAFAMTAVALIILLDHLRRNPEVAEVPFYIVFGGLVATGLTLLVTAASFEDACQ